MRYLTSPQATAQCRALPAAATACSSFAYESPEQARGLAYDGRNDVWALGCLLSEMLTLKFLGERGRGAIALDNSIVSTIVGEACAVHPELGSWVKRMMEVDPARRPTAQQLVCTSAPSLPRARVWDLRSPPAMSVLA